MGVEIFKVGKGKYEVLREGKRSRRWEIEVRRRSDGRVGVYWRGNIRNISSSYSCLAFYKKKVWVRSCDFYEIRHWL